MSATSKLSQTETSEQAAGFELSKLVVYRSCRLDEFDSLGEIRCYRSGTGSVKPLEVLQATALRSRMPSENRFIHTSKIQSVAEYGYHDRDKVLVEIAFAKLEAYYSHPMEQGTHFVDVSTRENFVQQCKDARTSAKMSLDEYCKASDFAECNREVILLVSVPKSAYVIITPDIQEIDGKTEVFITRTGKKFHLESCVYSRSALRCTMKEAILENKFPCGVCMPGPRFREVAGKITQSRIFTTDNGKCYHNQTCQMDKRGIWKLYGLSGDAEARALTNLKPCRCLLREPLVFSI
jgi:hypothetical protein